MKAITLWPEWAHAVAHLGKPWENRDWPPPRALIGQRIAIHAGKSIGGRPGRPAMVDAMEVLDATAFDAGHDIQVNDRHYPNGPVRVRDRDGVWRPIETGAIVCTAILGEPVRAHDDPPPWCNYAATWWWPLVDVRTLATPVPCRGAQGLWDVPDDVMRRAGSDGAIVADLPPINRCPRCGVDRCDGARDPSLCPYRPNPSRTEPETP